MIRRRNRVHFMARRVFEGTVCGETLAKQLLEKYKNATNKWGPQNDMQAFCRMMVLRLQRDPPNNLPGRYSRHAAGSTMFSADFKALLISCGVWMGDEELCRSVLSTMKGSIRSGILAELHDPLMANFPKFQTATDRCTLPNGDCDGRLAMLATLPGHGQSEHSAF